METTPRQSAHRPIKLIDPSSIAESEGAEPSNSPGAGGGDLAGLRLAEVLRAKLGVSRSGLERLVEAGDVSAADGADVLAAKLRPHQTILVRGRREQ